MQLSPEQIRRYATDGYLSPIRVMSEAQALELRRRLEAFEARQIEALDGVLRHKAHLLFPWLNDLIRHPPVLDAIESLYGKDLLCWTTNFFIKEPFDKRFVSWHQDSTYWGLSEPDVVTAWIAFSESSGSNGAVRVIPGSHHLAQQPHNDTFSAENLLTRGQEIAVDVDESSAVTLELQPGEMSLHHVRIVHGSSSNLSASRRIGFAIRYIPTYVRQLHGNDSASVVRGVDRFQHFMPEPSPTCELDPKSLAFHRKVLEQQTRILFSGSSIGSVSGETEAADRSPLE